MKKFLKTLVVSVGLAAGVGAYDQISSGHLDKHSIVMGALAGVVGLWIKKPGTENHESPLAVGK